MLNPIFSSSLEEDKIIFEIIDDTKCSLRKAENIFEEMKEFGLGLNGTSEDEIAEKYDLLLFAELRGYLNKKESDKAYEQVEKKKHFIQVIRESQEKYEPKYGPDRSKWPKEVLEEIKKEFDAEF